MNDRFNQLVQEYDDIHEFIRGVEYDAEHCTFAGPGKHMANLACWLKDKLTAKDANRISEFYSKLAELIEEVGD